MGFLGEGTVALVPIEEKDGTAIWEVSDSDDDDNDEVVVIEVPKPVGKFIMNKF